MEQGAYAATGADSVHVRRPRASDAPGFAADISSGILPTMATGSRGASRSSMERVTGRVRRAARRFVRALSPSVLVLLYHRVADVPCDPHQLCVTPSHFREHLEVLRAHGALLRLRDLASRVRQGRLPRRGFVVTFDDGYADNLENAVPLLERYDIPATVFVAGECVGREREFWWDELERLLLLPPELPRTLSLSIGGDRHEWNLGDAAVGAGQASSHRGWHVGQRDPSDRHAVYHSIYELLRPVPDAERQAILELVRDWAGAPHEVRATHRPLRVEEVGRLATSRLIEVGAHTLTHPVLGSLHRQAQWAEIRGSKIRLEEMTGRSVTSFAYPYGMRSRDYTAETVAMVREAGFGCACSYLPEPVRRDAEVFELPRPMVRDWDGDEFERRLRAWFAA
jgi:peptidoglycan/xylan/chitin deacetylase (PgdA/CDA1 family)